MYGTVAKLTVKPGKFEEMMALMDSYTDDSPGAVAIYGFRQDSNPEEAYMIAVFESKDSYFANAERPETNASYEKMMEYLEEEPQWNDGEIVYTKSFG